MNRAIAIRYGSIEESVSEGTEQPRHRGLKAVQEIFTRPFGSHQILLSCLTGRDVKMGSFLSRDLPGDAIKLILKYLDLRAANVAKRLFMKPINSSSMWKRGNGSSGVLAGFGSKARLAMIVLSNRLRPLGELRPVRSSKSIDNIPLNCIEMSLQQQHASKSASDSFADSRPHTAIPILDASDSEDRTDSRCAVMTRHPNAYIYYILSCLALIVVLLAMQSP